MDCYYILFEGAAHGEISAMGKVPPHNTMIDPQPPAFSHSGPGFHSGRPPAEKA